LKRSLSARAMDVGSHWKVGRSDIDEIEKGWWAVVDKIGCRGLRSRATAKGSTLGYSPWRSLASERPRKGGRRRSLFSAALQRQVDRVPFGRCLPSPTRSQDRSGACHCPEAAHNLRFEPRVHAELLERRLPKPVS